MIDWLFKRATVGRLRDSVEDLRGRLVVLAAMYEKLLKENEQQKKLIIALRDVNASMDQRCIDMERAFRQTVKQTIDETFGVKT